MSKCINKIFIYKRNMGRLKFKSDFLLRILENILQKIFRDFSIEYRQKKLFLNIFYSFKMQIVICISYQFITGIQYNICVSNRLKAYN